MSKTAVTYLGAVVLFILFYAFTHPNSVGDAVVYVDDVYQFHTGADSRRLWEFGHVLWRPAGWLLWRASQPLTANWYGGDARSEIMAALIALNLAATLGVALITVAICRLLGVNTSRTCAAVTFVICMNAILNWGQTGASYVVGFFFQLLATYLMMLAASLPARAVGYAAAAGLSLALAALVWFPYVLTAPAVLLLGLTYDAHAQRFDATLVRSRLRPVIVASVTASVAVVVVYGAIAIANQITTPSSFLAWVRHSSHGMSQNRRIFRMALGLPRGFIYLGNDGMVLKRLLLQDPYASVSWMDAVRLVLWKLPVFYLGLLALVVAMYRSRERWTVLWPLLLACAPMLFFVLVLFEAGSIERYLPAVALLVPGIAIAARDFEWRRVADKVLVITACIIVAVNLTAYAQYEAPERTSAAARIIQIRNQLKPDSRVVLLSTLDEIGQFYARYPVHEFTRQNRIPSYHLIEPGIRIEGGEFPAFARVAAETWERGGDIWISRRLITPRPRPEWEWVEGDNPALPWQRIVSYFSQFEVTDAVGGDDGFVRLPNTLMNRVIVAQTKAYGVTGRLALRTPVLSSGSRLHRFAAGWM